MAKIELKLSSKISPETGRQEILVRFFNGKRFNLRAKSEIYVSRDFFEYYVDRKRTRTEYNTTIPDKVTSATLDEAEKFGWALRDCGELVINKRIETPEVKYHKEQAERIKAMKTHIIKMYETSSKESVKGSWLVDVIDRFSHPEKHKKSAKTFYELSEEFLTKPHGEMSHVFADSHTRVYRVLIRAVARYEGYRQAKEGGGFTWDINTITQADLKDFFSYLKEEFLLAERYPTLFKKLLSNYPLSVKPGNRKLEERGDNTIIRMKIRLKTLFKYFYEEGYTANRPFDGIKIGKEKVGTPVYITIAERNRIAETNLAAIWEHMSEEERKPARMPIKTLLEQRDIFVFHCFVGCRIGDLIKLTSCHIDEGLLVYTPHKTKDSGEEATQARVPLHPKAIELIEKYKGADKKGRLFPFITPQRYNDAIKMIFKMSGITRNVEIRNAKTGENEIVPINTIASSHLARRTFVGNLYFKVQDPNLIGKMSGHVEGSEAFKRYRKIEDETLKDVISNLD